MINAYSLAAEVLDGTLDKTYPIVQNTISEMKLRPKVMKLSDETLSLLKNFSSINQSILFKFDIIFLDPPYKEKELFYLLNEIKNHNILKIGERIRDIIYIKKLNKIFLFLESSASIGVLEADSQIN